VATVLASLAAVRQAIGMHESAEQLWRKVLDIRERTLAPNHFATASALEHLGAACAARGKIQEAMSSFQRALTIREKTLGSEHPSLRVARERIADLQLQGSDDMLDSMAFADMPSTPERYRLLSGSDPLPQIGASSSSGQAAKTTPTAQIKLAGQTSSKAVAAEPRPPREKKNSLFVPRAYSPPVPVVADMPPDIAQSVPRSETAARTETVVMPIPSIEPAPDSDDEARSLATASIAYRDALESVREELESSETGEPFAQRARQILASVVAFAGKREVVAGIVVIAVALLGIAVATDRRALGESAQAASEASAAPRLSAVVPSAAADPIPVPTSNVSLSSSENGVAKTAKPRVSEERSTPKKVAEKKTETPAPVTIPALSTAVLSRLDSVAVKAAAVGSANTEQFNLQPAPAAAISQRRATFNDDQSNAAQRARLIGELPTPRVPNQVTDVEGEVRVRFNVDSLGQPVLESFSVVSSPNPLLTAAVRKVIPSMRFEPARTAGPDGKPIGDVVQIGFQFARSR
jgi:hypothetical protein